jgi:Protein of unknown function (DUF1501)
MMRSPAAAAFDVSGEPAAVRPVPIADLFETLATAMGLDPLETSMTPQGRPITLTDGGQVVRELWPWCLRPTRFPSWVELSSA